MQLFPITGLPAMSFSRYIDSAGQPFVFFQIGFVIFGVLWPSIFQLYKNLEIGHTNEKYSRDVEAKSNNVGENELDNGDKMDKCINAQLESFQRATTCLIILGQTVGLMPLLGVLREPPSLLRFKILSFKIVYGLVMFVSQTLIAMVNIWIMFDTHVSVASVERPFDATSDGRLRRFGTEMSLEGLAPPLGLDFVGQVLSVSHLSFYVSSAVTTLIFFQVAKKWPQLLRKLPRYQLDEYVDSRLKTKCNISITIFLTAAIAEHVLAEFAGVAALLDCVTDYTRMYRLYIEMSFPWVAEFDLPDHFLVGVSIQFINITTTLTWNYSDIFIVCISYYLTSILEGIYRKLIDNKTKYLSPSFWMSVREDYNHAAKLVRAFDDVVSGAVFVSFTTNLFFICFQLYNLLSDGVRHKTATVNCPRSGSGPLGGYENVIYLTYSMTFVLFRYLSVSLIAARVHTTAKSLAPVLYEVPSTVYNVEVQRFLDQVHHDTLALSGLQFFYVTKSLVLTVAGTIFTYELVLLQYGG